jgi:hypothetical protein
MSAITIPTALDEITPNFFNERCSLGGEVGDVSVTRIGEGVGLLGVLGRAELTYRSGSGPATVIVKLASPVPQLVEIATTYGFYDREVSFYREASSQLANVPRCYLADMHPSTSPFVIVMEDLSRLRMVDQLAGCSADDAHRVVRAAAKIHARYWANDALDRLTWLPPVNNPMYKSAQVAYNQVFDAFAAKYRDRVSVSSFNVAEALRSKMNTLQDEWFERGPLTLAHYDMRLDNVLFGDGDDVSFIDWQLSAKQFGAFDVAYFIGWSMTDDVRRAITASLIAAYHDQLLIEGIAGYSVAQCEFDVRQGMLGVQLMAAYASIAVPVENERGQALIDAYVERAFATVDDLDSGETLP